MPPVEVSIDRPGFGRSTARPDPLARSGAADHGPCIWNGHPVDPGAVAGIGRLPEFVPDSTVVGTPLGLEGELPEVDRVAPADLADEQHFAISGQEATGGQGNAVAPERPVHTTPQIVAVGQDIFKARIFVTGSRKAF